MTTATRTLGWIGLSPHEAEMVRCVGEALADGLTESWQIDAGARDDVVLIDPHSSPGRDTVAAGSHPIAILNRTDRLPEGYRHYVLRPLRPRAIVAAMNAAVADYDEGADSTGDEMLAAERVSKPLARALRDAAVDRDRDMVHVIDGVGAAPLVVDGTDDRLRGPFEAMDLTRLHDPTPVGVRTVSRLAAADVAIGAPETVHCSHLWRTVCREPDEEPLFGDIDATSFQLERWPNFSVMQIPRDLFRVATRARYGTSTVREIAQETGVTPERVIALFNAAWLTGYLNAGEHQPRTAVDPAKARRGSLASRIRRRLGTI